MTKTKRMEEYEAAAGDAEICGNCKHFVRHYIYDDKCRHSFATTCLGHCTYPRLKNRKQWDTCENFESVFEKGR